MLLVPHTSAYFYWVQGCNTVRWAAASCSCIRCAVLLRPQPASLLLWFVIPDARCLMPGEGFCKGHLTASAPINRHHTSCSPPPEASCACQAVVTRPHSRRHARVGWSGVVPAGDSTTIVHTTLGLHLQLPKLRQAVLPSCVYVPQLQARAILLMLAGGQQGAAPCLGLHLQLLVSCAMSTLLQTPDTW